MEKTFVETMKEELLVQREELLRQIENESEGYRALVEDMDPKDIIDQASDDVDTKNLEAVSVLEAKKLQLIDNALGRIQTGRYGTCLECAKPISRPRLEAIPYALFCIECQAKKDRQGR